MPSRDDYEPTLVLSRLDSDRLLGATLLGIAGAVSLCAFVALGVRWGWTLLLVASVVALVARLVTLVEPIELADVLPLAHAGPPAADTEPVAPLRAAA
jgi:hypothetical protein